MQLMKLFFYGFPQFLPNRESQNDDLTTLSLLPSPSLNDFPIKGYSPPLTLIQSKIIFQNVTGSLQNKRLIARLNVYLSVFSLACLLVSLAIFSMK